MRISEEREDDSVHCKRPRLEKARELPEVELLRSSTASEVSMTGTHTPLLDAMQGTHQTYLVLYQLLC